MMVRRDNCGKPLGCATKPTKGKFRGEPRTVNGTAVSPSPRKVGSLNFGSVPRRCFNMHVIRKYRISQVSVVKLRTFYIATLKSTVS